MFDSAAWQVHGKCSETLSTFHHSQQPHHCQRCFGAALLFFFLHINKFFSVVCFSVSFSTDLADMSPPTTAQQFTAQHTTQHYTVLQYYNATLYCSRLVCHPTCVSPLAARHCAVYWLNKLLRLKSPIECDNPVYKYQMTRLRTTILSRWSNLFHIMQASLHARVCLCRRRDPLMCLLVSLHVKLIHTPSEMGHRGARHSSLVFTLPQPALIFCLLKLDV